MTHAGRTRSTTVGFHVRTEPEGTGCGGEVKWHDSPALSWLECEKCGANSQTGAVVSYGAPVSVSVNVCMA